MDNVTHSLFALTLARTRLGRPRGATAVLLLASNAPDIDVVSTAGGLLDYLQWHRGPTHGPLGIVGLGLVTAGLVHAFIRLRSASAPAALPRYASLAGIAMLGVLLHVLMDLPTSYGTRILSPFDWHWFAADWMPIVDLYLLVALLAGLYFGRGSDTARYRNVVIVLSFMVANYGLRALAHHQAIALAPRLLGPTLPAPCEGSVAAGGLLDKWPRDVRPVLPPPGQVRCLVEVAAVPGFMSPFEWRVIARTSNSYELHPVDLLDTRFRTEPEHPEVLWRLGTRFPDIWTPEALTAAETRTGRLFLGFSRFPAARTFRDRQGYVTTQFRDMRFTTALPAGPGGRGINPNSRNLFSMTVLFDGGQRVIEERLGP